MALEIVMVVVGCVALFAVILGVGWSAVALFVGVADEKSVEADETDPNRIHA